MKDREGVAGEQKISIFPIAHTGEVQRSHECNAAPVVASRPERRTPSVDFQDRLLQSHFP